MIRDDFHLFFVFLLFNVVERQYKKKRIRDMDENNVPEMRPTFEEIRKVDGNGKEYWSSRELCNAMGYSGYWKFQNVIDKAIKVASEKGMDIDDHFNHVVEMVKLGSGSFLSLIHILYYIYIPFPPKPLMTLMTLTLMTGKREILFSVKI